MPLIMPHQGLIRGGFASDVLATDESFLSTGNVGSSFSYAPTAFTGLAVQGYVCFFGNTSPIQSVSLAGESGSTSVRSVGGRLHGWFNQTTDDTPSWQINYDNPSQYYWIACIALGTQYVEHDFHTYSDSTFSGGPPSGDFTIDTSVGGVILGGNYADSNGTPPSNGAEPTPWDNEFFPDEDPLEWEVFGVPTGLQGLSYSAWDGGITSSADTGVSARIKPNMNASLGAKVTSLVFELEPV